MLDTSDPQYASRILNPFIDESGNRYSSPNSGGDPNSPSYRTYKYDPALSSDYASRINANPTAPDLSAPVPVDENKIRTDKLNEAQALVNNINAQFAPLFSQQEEQNKANNDRTRALNISSGLGGSDFASSAAIATEERGNKANKLLQDEKAAKIAEVLSKVSSQTDEAIAAQRKQFNEDTTAYLERKKNAIDEAKTNIQTLAAAGTDLDKLKSTEPDVYKRLLEGAGFKSDLEFDAYFNTSKPKAAQTDFQTTYSQDASGNAVMTKFGVNPVTKDLEKHTYNLGIPYSQVVSQDTKEIDGVLYGKQADGSWKPLTKPSEKSVLDLQNKRLQNAKLVKEIADQGKTYLNEPLSAIDQLKGGDGYVNPQAYRDLYAEFIKNNPGKGDEFLKNFPINIYINPDEQYQFNK